MVFVLSWRCIVSSGKSSSCLSITNKLRWHSPSFTFSLLSSLPLSSSSHITTPLNIISDLLTQECGFSSSQVTTAMRRSPQLLRKKSDQTARKVIHFLKDFDISENRLKNIILRDPSILLRKVDNQLKPKMEFLQKMGLATHDIARIVYRAPRLFGFSLEKCLAPRILHLETLFGSRVPLCKALRTAPELLTSDFEKQVKPKVEYLKNSIGILESSTSFARALDAVLCLRFETLDAKIKHMASLGLGVEKICQFLKTYPHALRISTKKLKENIDFLVHTARLEPKAIASNSFIVGLSLEKRLVPRHKVFQSLRTSPHVEGLPNLIRFFSLTEKEFLKYADQFTDQCSNKSSPMIIQAPKESILQQL